MTDPVITNELRDAVGADVFQKLRGNGSVRFDTDAPDNAMRDWTNYFVRSVLRSLVALNGPEFIAQPERDRPLAVELHDTYCAAGDWPHVGECVAFEGYEVAANPLLTVLAGRGYARRADVSEVEPAPVVDVQAGYEAVYAVIRARQQSERPSSVQVNALIWSAVHAFREAMGIEAKPLALARLLNGGAK